MDKEEAIKQFKNYFPDGVEAIVLTKEDYERQLGQLQYENIILRNRIDKTIEYMNNFWKENYYYDDDLENCMQYAIMCEYDRNDLLNILKGGNNE